MSDLEQSILDRSFFEACLSNPQHAFDLLTGKAHNFNLWPSASRLREGFIYLLGAESSALHFQRTHPNTSLFKNKVPSLVAFFQEYPKLFEKMDTFTLLNDCAIHNHLDLFKFVIKNSPVETITEELLTQCLKCACYGSHKELFIYIMSGEDFPAPNPYLEEAHNFKRVLKQGQKDFILFLIHDWKLDYQNSHLAFFLKTQKLPLGTEIKKAISLEKEKKRLEKIMPVKTESPSKLKSKI